jgi:hypothetical protein
LRKEKDQLMVEMTNEMSRLREDSRREIDALKVTVLKHENAILEKTTQLVALEEFMHPKNDLVE